MEKRFLGHLLRLAASFPLHPENTPHWTSLALLKKPQRNSASAGGSGLRPSHFSTHRRRADEICASCGVACRSADRSVETGVKLRLRRGFEVMEGGRTEVTRSWASGQVMWAESTSSLGLVNIYVCAHSRGSCPVFAMFTVGHVCFDMLLQPHSSVSTSFVLGDVCFPLLVKPLGICSILPGFLKQTQDMTLRDGGMAVDTPGSPL